MSEIVELRMAYEWTCPECGTDHFHRGLVPELDEEDQQQVKDQLGIEPWEEGLLMMAPEKVTCPDCKGEFVTENFGEGEE